MGNLGTTVILVRVARLKPGSHLHLQVAALFNQAVPYALDKVGKPGMVLRTNITVYGCTRSGRIFYGVLPGLYRASRQLPKSRSGVSPSADFETMASHDAGVVYFTEYLSVLCVNSGYQALSPITKSAWERS